MSTNQLPEQADPVAAAPTTPDRPSTPPKDPYADAKLIEGPPPLPEDGAFTVVVLPDTQHYTGRFPEPFYAQTEWIVAQQQRRRIACVLHLGDFTNRNAVPEWEHAAKAMSTLDGRLPYFMVPGNHDCGEGGHSADRSTLFNEYFPLAKYRSSPHFGGVYDREPDRFENNYHLFSAAGRDFLVLGLEFGPRRDVVRWANEVAERHRDRSIILLTHAYMYYDDRRYDWSKYGLDQRWNPHCYPFAQEAHDDVYDGEELWRDLICRHENFILTLNGHVLESGLGRLTSATPTGREVTQMLVNFQMKPNGGDGWLRLLEFRADRKTVVAQDYSPTRDQRNLSPRNTFTFTIPSEP